jgi:hypothetical protein
MPHISYCFIFESDYLSKFQSTTHTYGHYFENKPIYDMMIIKLFTWFINLFQSYGITMFNRYYKFHMYSKSFQSFIEYIL